MLPVEIESIAAQLAQQQQHKQIMNITFTRTSERSYVASVVRDALTIQVSAFDRPTALPHDIAHYIVERELELKHGFWGCVAAGAIFPGMQVLSGRPAVRAAERSKAVIREMETTQWGTEAEVLVSVLEKIMRAGLEDNYPAARALLNEVWKPSKPSRELPTAEEIKRICLALRQIEQQWQALAIGQSITVSWSLTRKSKSKSH